MAFDQWDEVYVVCVAVLVALSVLKGVMDARKHSEDMRRDMKALQRTIRQDLVFYTILGTWKGDGVIPRLICRRVRSIMGDLRYKERWESDAAVSREEAQVLAARVLADALATLPRLGGCPLYALEVGDDGSLLRWNGVSPPAVDPPDEAAASRPELTPS